MFLRLPAHSAEFTRFRHTHSYPKALPFRCKEDKMSPSGPGGSSLGERREELAAWRPIFALCAAIAVALAGAGPALAVSPQTIYKDLADNGRLDRHYSRTDIQRAFDLDEVVRIDRSPPRVVRRPTAVAVPSQEKRSAPAVPFTG